MKNKIVLSIVVGFLLVSFMASCNKNSRSLTECGESVIDLMSEMIGNEEYVSIYNLPSTYDATIYELRDGDYAKSVAVYELMISEEELLTSIDCDINKESCSENLYQYLVDSAYVSFSSFLNKESGSEAMTISSVFMVQKVFVSESDDMNRIYLYVFENGCPVVISFISEGNGTVRAVGHFIINDNFVTDNEQSIEKYCNSWGIMDVTVREIS